jgi:hemolysin activation/secretion protein
VIGSLDDVRGNDRSMRSAAWLLLAPILACWGTPGVAQNVRPPTREQVTRPVTPAPPPRGSRLEVEGGVERAPCALAGPEFANIRLTLTGAEFDGLQGLTSADLISAYAPFVGREQPISVVCEIRDRAATILRNAGYIAAVQVPQQNIANGQIHFHVLMAHLVQIRVRGNASGAEQIIAGYLRELTKQPVFNRLEAERYLLLASDLPGYTVRLTLRPAGGAPGDVIGDVTVQRQPAYVDMNVEDLGSHQLGPWGGALRAQLYGLTGLGDRTTLAIFSSADFHEQQTVQVGHDFFLGSQGLSVGGNFTYAWARPHIPDTNVIARTLLGTLQIGYPFIRSQSRTLRGSAGLDYINQIVNLDGIPLTRDRLRVAFARLGFDAQATHFTTPGYSYAEPPWRLSGLLELRQGLDIFGASEFCGGGGTGCGVQHVPPSRLNGSPTETLLRFVGYGELRPIPKLTFALGGRAQYAWNPLMSFEQFSAGNYTVGRGYAPGDLLGDSGWGTQAEIRFGSRIPPSARSAGIEGYLFWDHAAVHDKHPLVVEVGSKQLDSVGGGARISFDRFDLDAGVAVPLTHIGPENLKPKTKLLISLTTRLWPWSYQ